MKRGKPLIFDNAVCFECGESFRKNRDYLLFFWHELKKFCIKCYVEMSKNNEVEYSLTEVMNIIESIVRLSNNKKEFDVRNNPKEIFPN